MPRCPHCDFSERLDAFTYSAASGEHDVDGDFLVCPNCDAVLGSM
jgi:uncharacterized C2H2 Zn-finger protein